MKLKVFAFALVVAAGLLVARPVAQDAPKQAPPAKGILDAALATANSTNRNVFVHFSASWCGWCHKLEAFLKTDEGAMLQKYAVDVMLVVQESGEKKILENPGGAELMKGWGGTGGIPFYVFLDGKGTVLSDANNMVDAKGNKGNIGYPANPKEMAAFDDMVMRGLPKMPADVRAKIMTYLAAHP
ncbi:MAG: thioredoxin family protein [Acidobacteriota bacterium]